MAIVGRYMVRAVMLVLLAAPLAAQSGSAAARAAIAGCYQVHIGPLPTLTIGADSVYTTVPDRIRLDTTRAESGGFTILPARDLPRTVHRFAVWRLADSGRVVLIWSNGFSGLRASVRAITDDSLSGEARTFWDMGRPSHTASFAVARLHGSC